MRSKIISLLNVNEKKKLIRLFLLTFVTAFFQLAAIVSIVPFIAIISNPNIVNENTKMKLVQEYFAFSNHIEMLFVTGLFVILTLFLSNIFQALSSWQISKFGYELGKELSKRLVLEYISRPYLYFINTNSAELMKNINQEAGRVSNGILIPILLGIAGSIRITFIVLLLLFVDVLATISMAVFVSSSYIIIGLLVKNRLTRNGEEISTLSFKRFKVIRELFSGIKEVKLLGKENIFVDEFVHTTEQMVKHEIFGKVVSDLPKYLLEIITVGALLAVSLYLLVNTDDSSQILPLIGLFVISGYRMMPAMQEVYGNFTKIKFALPALDIISKELGTIKDNRNEFRVNHNLRMKVMENIKLQNINFTYPTCTKPAIDNLNIEVKANSSIGLIGASGSGKSTLVDIFLGLLQPQSGEFKVDNVTIDQKNLRNWQNNIGYVPQHIYLTDDTIAKNIALGTSNEDIDMDAVKKASQAASLHTFIEKELPLKYEAEIGESGVRLSGGQRQRIGIARALYHSPSVLILDEATSALDSVTESAVTESVHNLSGKITTIIIAHRISTLKECDVIYIMSEGKIVESGSYKTLMMTSNEFRKLSKSHEIDENS